jgi:hypothetical protein
MAVARAAGAGGRVMGFKTEKDLSKALRKRLEEWRPGSMYRRIEDASGNLGTFDVFMAAKADWPERPAQAAWVELKVAGPNAQPIMRMGQPAFGHDLLVAGVPAYVLVGHPDGSVRLLRGDTKGEDWLESLIGRYQTLDDTLLSMLFIPLNPRW